MLLIVFDIDGTLIRSSNAGKRVMQAALRRVFGTAGPIDVYQFAGRTDSAIIRDLLTYSGVANSEIDRGMEAVFEEMVRFGEEAFPQDGLVPCVGVPDLLEALSQRQRVMLGLLTGNARGTALLKLRVAGIAPSQFSYGAFGSDAADRNELPEIARKRAVALSAGSWANADMIVVGDTPADIECARAAGATSVAVATGRYPAAQLQSHEPDHLLPDLADTESALRTLRC